MLWQYTQIFGFDWFNVCIYVYTGIAFLWKGTGWDRLILQWSRAPLRRHGGRVLVGHIDCLRSYLWAATEIKLLFRAITLHPASYSSSPFHSPQPVAFRKQTAQMDHYKWRGNIMKMTGRGFGIILHGIPSIDTPRSAFVYIL